MAQVDLLLPLSFGPYLQPKGDPRAKEHAPPFYAPLLWEGLDDDREGLLLIDNGFYWHLTEDTYSIHLMIVSTLKVTVTSDRILITLTNMKKHFSDIFDRTEISNRAGTGEPAIT